ncbi:helix-turn-helix domain-containing protein [Streptomyces sp. NPDC051020]|uniref:helix-turn-helix domain-containing protein n=1 Tax=Streptomyces sp. NPDC051020 TaxID=3155409 RepID=UPI003447C155
MTDAERAARERIRLQAVERFESGEKNREIATALRVSLRSVERWRRQWREGGAAGVASKGSPGRPKLSEAQVKRLEHELERGPLAYGWEDQRWTLARVKALIGRLFHVSHTVEGTWVLLQRHGWSWQQRPARPSNATTRLSSCGGRNGESRTTSPTGPLCRPRLPDGPAHPAGVAAGVAASVIHCRPAGYYAVIASAHHGRASLCI